MSAPKYCPDPDNCTYSDCPTAFCDREGSTHSLQRLCSAFAVIESMRQKGYCVQLDNGLDGTWEAQFYKPSMYGSTNEELEKTYGAGATLLLAVTEAAKNTPNSY